MEGAYVKDLRIIADRELEDLVIVDNSMVAFGYQLDNGVPISSYIEGTKD
jgi:CTD small phosphatase-like protein 2